MDQIVGEGSTMLTMVDTLEARLVANPTKAGYDYLDVPIKPSPLALTQWSQHTILGNNIDFWLSGSNEKQLVSFQDVKSMKDLGMNFNVPPEFEPKGELTVDQAILISYNGASFSSSSLIYPMNMYEAWFNHATTDPPIFSSRTDEQESEYIVDWFTE
jgi:hypothetical protein